MKPKAIFFDLDGTLYINGQIPKSAVDALKYAKSKGVLLFIATGRTKKDAIRLTQLPGIIFDGYVCMNGGYCFVDSEVIFKNPIHKDDVRFAVEYTRNSPYSCMFCEAEDVYVNIFDDKAKEVNARLFLPTPPICDPICALDTDIYQLVVWGDELKMAFNENMKHVLFTTWGDGCYDVIPADINKWEGILHMLSRFGLKPEEIATIGDGDNDLEMIEKAGFSVAMDNGKEMVKKAAKYVTGAADDDGILQAVEYILG